MGLFVVFEENGYVMEGVGETPAEDEVGVCIEAAWKGIMRERVGVLSPQGERAEFVVKPSVSLLRARSP